MAILIDDSTRIVVQGITGREATTFTKHSLDYGAKVVAGCTPGKGGESIYGVPVYDCVAEAVARHGANTSVISVPAGFVRGAVYEAVDAGARLVVVVTERVPRHDVVDFIAFAIERGARIVGPNSLGILSPPRAKAGMVGGPAEDVRKAYTEGPVGIVSRSGGMTTEIANLLTLAGIGQSTCVSIGGDPVVGTTYMDVLPLFQEDPATQAMVIFCEPGGNAEETFSEFYVQGGYTLPVFAFIAGRFVDEMPGMRFGHAAVLVEGERGSTKTKMAAMRAAGIHVVEELHDLVAGLRAVLKH